MWHSEKRSPRRSRIHEGLLVMMTMQAFITRHTGADLACCWDLPRGDR